MIAAFNSQVLSRTGNAVTTRVGLLGGINDLAAGATESDLINRWKSYAALCAANNLPLRISTLLPANAAGAAYQPRIANLNGWLRRNWQTLADTFVDFWENPNLTNADNSTYFEADGHQTPEGSVEMAAAVDAAMKKNVFIDRFKRTNGAAGNGWDYRTATGSFLRRRGCFTTFQRPARQLCGEISLYLSPGNSRRLNAASPLSPPLTIPAASC